QYLGYYFDRKLDMKLHTSMYAAKASSTITSLCWLGNSWHRLQARHRHALYISCILPVLYYG
ncbi:hypothetical protein BDN72DRAFT_750744, partial [Pluteus cervinus]